MSAQKYIKDEERKLIPEEFLKEGVRIRNVGELKEAIAKLPDSLPFQSEWADPVKLLVVNFRSDDTYLCAEPTDDDDDE